MTCRTAFRPEEGRRVHSPLVHARRKLAPANISQAAVGVNRPAFARLVTKEWQVTF